MQHDRPASTRSVLRVRARLLRQVLAPLALVTVLVGLLVPVADAGATGIALGAYVQPAPTPGHPNAAIDSLNAGLGRHLAIYQTFVDWETTAGVANPFPLVFANYVASLGATPMVTWQPQATPVHGQSPSSQPDFSLAQILTGRYDGFIRGWADQARGFGQTVYVRLMHEMNGKWYPWGNGINGNTPALYVAAWQHIVTLFLGEGATNVRFVWCASAGAHWSAAPYYPGDPWAAWIALDGYNRAATWRSFTQVLVTRYADITAVSTLPVMIAETASPENPLDTAGKADWINSAFLQEIPQAFPRVQVALYFDAPIGGTQQVLTSSAGSFAAFVQVAASPLYQALAPG
ncbi:MAG TPA: glycosyl hydrolase [Acidimicrobiales bacterium]